MINKASYNINLMSMQSIDLKIKINVYVIYCKFLFSLYYWYLKFYLIYSRNFYRKIRSDYS